MIPYETIEPATKGDLRAILKILKHYDPYMEFKQSVRTYR